MRIARLLFAVSTAALTLTTNLGAQGRPLPTARDDQARLRSAVEAAGNRMEMAYNRGEIEGFVRNYSDDVWVFPPNAQPFQGRPAAFDFFQRSYSDGFRNFQITTTGLDRQGTMAYETGTYSGDITSAGQATRQDNGKYVQIWKRNPSGDWRIHFVMWSSNNPPPPMSR
jgi:ketosteroid isomerase-like protein